MWTELGPQDFLDWRSVSRVLGKTVYISSVKGKAISLGGRRRYVGRCEAKRLPSWEQQSTLSTYDLALRWRRRFICGVLTIGVFRSMDGRRDMEHQSSRWIARWIH